MGLGGWLCFFWGGIAHLAGSLGGGGVTFTTDYFLEPIIFFIFFYIVRIGWGKGMLISTDIFWGMADIPDIFCVWLIYRISFLRGGDGVGVGAGKH